MVLSNAERQKRHRERLKAQALPQQLPDRARDAANAAVSAMWAFFNRPSPNGTVWGDIDDIESSEALAAAYVNDCGLAEACRRFIQDPDESLTADELAAVRLVVEIHDALSLANLKQPKARAGRA